MPGAFRSSETTFPCENPTKARTNASARPGDTYTLFSGILSSFAEFGAVVCQYSCIYRPPGHWTIASRPMGSGNGATTTSAPLAFADWIAVSMSVTRYPVRSTPNGYGIGVVKPNTENVPPGVDPACHIVLLGVGVIVN